MSKSSGNFITLQTLVDEGFDPLDYRFFLLGAHYRSQVAFSREAMESARNSRAALVRRIAAILRTVRDNPGEIVGPLPEGSPAAVYLDRFREHLEQDLATPRALSELQMLVKDSSVPPEQIVSAVNRMDSVLGLNLTGTAGAEIGAGQENSAESGAVGAEVERLIAERSEAKKRKDYQRADDIRAILKEQGVLLEDTPQGTVWKRI
jgi:cysteinyl-tRNA synthetase